MTQPFDLELEILKDKAKTHDKLCAWLENFLGCKPEQLVTSGAGCMTEHVNIFELMEIAGGAWEIAKMRAMKLREDHRKFPDAEPDKDGERKWITIKQHDAKL